jgi:hypothetical protein
MEDVAAPEALAGEDFSDAWVPAERNETDHETATGAGVLRTSTTPEAADALRESEKALAKAATEEEKAAIRRDTNIYRLNLAFAGEEADTVKKGLGDSPALTILEWCKANT